MEHKKPKPKPTQRGSQRGSQKGSQRENQRGSQRGNPKARSEQRGNPEVRQKSFQKSKTEQRGNPEARQKSFQKSKTEQRANPKAWPKTEQRARTEQRESQNSKTNPGVRPETEQRGSQRGNPKAWPKTEQRGSQRGNPKTNPKEWTKPYQKVNPKTNPRANENSRTNLELRQKSNPEARQKSFQKSKTEQRVNSEARPKTEQRESQRGNPKAWPKTEQRGDSKTNPILKRTKRIKSELAVLGYHALLEALNQGHALKYVSISENTETQKRRDLIDLCHKKKVSVMLLSKTEMEKNYPGLMHRGFLGELKSTIESIPSLEDFLNNQTEKNCVVVALDGISDQQNLGAMIRSCYFFNVSLMVSEIRNSAPIDHMTHRSSAGASLRQPFHWANKLSQALQMFKDKNFTIIGAVTERHPKAQPYQMLKLEKPTVLIVGNEESGLRPHVLRFCNQLTTIQRKNNFDSLNVSVSLGILLAHLNK